ncbi:hypothetical protein, partial [Rhizobium sp.]
MSHTTVADCDERRSRRKCEFLRAECIILCIEEHYETRLAVQWRENLGFSKKVHKARISSLTVQNCGPITRFIERGGGVASGGSVARSNVLLLIERFWTLDSSYLSQICGNA